MHTTDTTTGKLRKQCIVNWVIKQPGKFFQKKWTQHRRAASFSKNNGKAQVQIHYLYLLKIIKCLY